VVSNIPADMQKELGVSVVKYSSRHAKELGASRGGIQCVQCLCCIWTLQAHLRAFQELANRHGASTMRQP
jgi:hypothetical protein